MEGNEDNYAKKNCLETILIQSFAACSALKLRLMSGISVFPVSDLPFFFCLHQFRGLSQDFNAFTYVRA